MTLDSLLIESLFCKIEFAVMHKKESPLGALFCKIKMGNRTLIISVSVALRYSAPLFLLIYSLHLFVVFKTFNYSRDTKFKYVC